MLGSTALYLMLNEAIADRILRKWTQIIAYSYNVGKYGLMWPLWAATTNVCLVLLMFSSRPGNKPQKRL
jgi:hypothetical protein